MSHRRPGRPSILEVGYQPQRDADIPWADDSPAKRFLTALNTGNARVVAAKHAGLHVDTVRRWIRQGEDLQLRIDQDERCEDELQQDEQMILRFFVAE